MEINIQHLVGDACCYETIRDLRWPGKVFSLKAWEADSNFKTTTTPETVKPILPTPP